MLAGYIARTPLAGIAASSLLACGGGDLLLPSGVPAELRLVSGDLQQAQTGATLPDSLVVEALDANGRPVVGSRIHFRFEVDTDGRVNPDTARTDDLGLAAAQVRLGKAAGGHPVEASVVDGPTRLRVRFLLTAVARNPGGGGGDGGGGGFTPDPPQDPEPPPPGDGGGGGGGGDGGNGGGNDDDDDDDDRDDVDEDEDDDDDERGDRGKGKGKGKGEGGDSDDDDD